MYNVWYFDNWRFLCADAQYTEEESAKEVAKEISQLDNKPCREIAHGDTAALADFVNDVLKGIKNGVTQ